MAMTRYVARWRVRLVGQLSAVVGLGLAVGWALSPTHERPSAPVVQPKPNADQRLAALKRAEANEPPETLTATYAPSGGEVDAVFYRVCDDARLAGAAPLYRGDAGYRDALDRDGDGIACEPYVGR